MARTTLPTLENLKQAILIAEKIQRLEADLAAIVGGSGITSVAGKRRGRPRKVEVDLMIKTPESKKVAKKKRSMSEEGRQRIIEAQKKRWASVQKTKKA